MLFHIVSLNYRLKSFVAQVWWYTLLILVFKRQSQVELCIQGHVVYIVSTRTARLCRKGLFQKTNQQQKALLINYSHFSLLELGLTSYI